METSRHFYSPLQRSKLGFFRAATQYLLPKQNPPFLVGKRNVLIGVLLSNPSIRVYFLLYSRDLSLSLSSPNLFFDSLSWKEPDSLWKRKSKLNSRRAISFWGKRRRFFENVCFLFCIFFSLNDYLFMICVWFVEEELIPFSFFALGFFILSSLGLSFCINYKLSPSDLVSSWEIYHLNR